MLQYLCRGRRVRLVLQRMPDRGVRPDDEGVEHGGGARAGRGARVPDRVADCAADVKDRVARLDAAARRRLQIVQQYHHHTNPLIPTVGCRPPP